MIKRLFCILFSIFMSVASAFAWDFSQHSIPLEEIYSGGVSKDGIPALTDPKFITAYEAKYLKPEDRVLGIYLGGEAKVYPLKILNWHEIVNDIVGGKPVVIAYCPLTGSGLAYDAKINEKRAIFGVSGNLYNSNVLFYDRGTESLWSQLKMEAVTGQMTGTRLKPLPILNTTWQDWKRRHPDIKVLSLDTGYVRDYNRDPYQGYRQIEVIYFPISNINKKISAKEWILGVIIDGKAKAYPFSVLDKVNLPLPDKLGDKNIRIYYDKKQRSAWIEMDGEVIPSVQVYWFSWYAFYPETEIYFSDK